MADPTQGSSKRSNPLAVVGLGVVIAGAAAYTVIASREAAVDSRSDAELLRDGLAGRSFFMPDGAMQPVLQPAAGCSGTTAEALNEAVRQAQDPHLARSAEQRARELLSADPGCAQAARVVTALARRIGGSAEVLRVRADVVDKANAEPRSAGRQLAAALFAGALHDGKAMRQWLERAEAADTAAPLLHFTWAWWWDQFSAPRDLRKEIDAYEAEVASTDDDASLAALTVIEEQLGETEEVEPKCQRLAGHLPLAMPLAFTCAKAAMSRADVAAEARWRDAFLQSAEDEVSEPCKHADLAWLLLTQTCRADEALRESEYAIAHGCAVPGSGQRRDALLRLKRFEEAAEPPGPGGYWRGVHGESRAQPSTAASDEVHRAMALTLLDREGDALAVLQQASDAPSVTMLRAMIEDGEAKELIAPRPCVPPKTGNERLAGIAGMYSEWGMPSDARVRLEKALAVDPKSETALTNMVHVLMIEGKLDEAIAMGEQAKLSGVEGGTLAQNIGFAYQEKGDCEKALPFMLRARQDKPFEEANYTNLARCLDSVGNTGEAKKYWRYVSGGAPRVMGWMYALLVVGAAALYLGAKLALIKLLPSRFGHLKFP